MNDKKPRPYKHPQINLRIPEELKTKIQKIADENNRSMNAEIVFMLEQSLSGNLKAYDKYEVFEIAKQALKSYTELLKNKENSES